MKKRTSSASGEGDGSTVATATAPMRSRRDGEDALSSTSNITSKEEEDNKKDSPSAEDFARSADKSDGARSTVGGNLSSVSNISPNEAESKQEPTLENILQLAPALKKAALEYGARDENGKVTFADEERKQEFLKVAKALLSAGERKFSKAWTDVSNVIVRGDEFGSYRDIKELRKKAIAYYQKYLQGTSVENAQLGKVDIDRIGLVEFTGSGKREVKSTSAKQEKLLLVKHLPELIRSATNITENAAQKQRHATDYFYYLHTSVEINGQTIPVDITLVKRNDGSIQFFNHILPTLENGNKNELPVSAEPVFSKETLGTPPVGSSSISNIPLGKEESKQEKLFSARREEILQKKPCHAPCESLHRLRVDDQP